MNHDIIAILAQETSTAAAKSASLPWMLAVMVAGALLVLGIARFISTLHLALGFACTASMWLVGYVSMMAPGLWIGEALFAGILALPVVFGAIARRASASPLKVGLVSAFANLLVIGAFLGDDQGRMTTVSQLYIGGLFAASALLALFGGWLARRAKPIALPATAGLFALVHSQVLPRGDEPAAHQRLDGAERQAQAPGDLQLRKAVHHREFDDLPLQRAQRVDGRGGAFRLDGALAGIAGRGAGGIV